MAALFWFRRDLRLQDNTALYHALKQENEVIPFFCFDKKILDKLENRLDARVSFIHSELQNIQKKLEAINSTLIVKYSTPTEAIEELISLFDISAIYTNHDYESYAKERDNQVQNLADKHQITFRTFKDQVIFEKDEVIKDDGTPYTVFTPYSKKWKMRLSEADIASYDNKKYYSSFWKSKQIGLPSLESMGFSNTSLPIPSPDYDLQIIKNYDETRDFPAIKGTSKMGVHLRFGTVSVRELARVGKTNNNTYLNEIIWRDFYMMILHHFPHVEKGAFRAKYDRIPWENNPTHFKAWCEGKTGYPLVDAGMRELNATGYMHNRVRMVVASFLCKHLLIDWQWGAAYFAEKLLDFDLSANNGGWQWAAGCGTDAAPYFRIFNPESQLKKFDKELKYVRRWVKEFDDPFSYPQPIVEHKFARERCLSVYKETLNGN